MNAFKMFSGIIIIYVSRYKNVNHSNEVLRCLPYFFLIGQPKCATTDIFHRINSHPDVAEPLLKGPNWWTRKRFGKGMTENCYKCYKIMHIELFLTQYKWSLLKLVIYLCYISGEPYAPQPVPLSEYIDLFNASKIKGNKQTPGKLQGTWEYPSITGDGSTSTLWDSSQTMSYLHYLMTTHKCSNIIKVLLQGRKEANSVPNVRNSSRIHAITYEHIHTHGLNRSPAAQKGIVLPFTVADVIHLMLPRSRVIAVFREPVSR